MKAILHKNGDAGLYFCDLKAGDDFIFIENEGLSTQDLDKPAVKLDNGRYFYYGGFKTWVCIERSRIKVARIRATSEVVFVIDCEKGD